MAKRGVDWLGIAGAFIRYRPKTSIAIAFELGMVAAQFVNKAGGARRSMASVLPSKFIELAPSISDLGGYLDRRRRTKASVPKRTRKPVAKRTPRKKVPKASPQPPAQSFE